MKKKIFILLLAVLMISTPVFADGMAACLVGGALLAGLGGIAWATNLGGVGDVLGPFGLGLGAVVGIIGLFVGIGDYIAEGEAPSGDLYLAKAEGEADIGDLSLVSQIGYGTQKEKDSIFDHLLFGTDGRNTYLGVRFSW